MDQNIVIGAGFLSTGITTIAVCVPLLLGKIRRNGVYGIRIPKSFESDEVWFAINRYGAEQMIIWAATMMAFGVGAMFLPLRDSQALGIWFGITVVLSLLVPVFQIFRYSKQL